MSVGSVVVGEYACTGVILRLPSAVLAVGLMLSGLLSTATGFLLHTINRRFQELDHLLRMQQNQPTTEYADKRAA